VHNLRFNQRITPKFGFCFTLANLIERNLNMNYMTYPPSVSYWEIKEYLRDIDLLVVGSGIVGLTTAIFYKKKHPNRKVLVVEKGILPSGASTKNAGFACFGSPSEILADREKSSEKEVFDTVLRRVRGLSALRSLVGDANMDYAPCGGYEVFRETDKELYQRCLENLDTLNSKLEEYTALKSTYSIADDQVHKLGFSGVNHLILNKHEGSIDTGKMMNRLLHLARETGIIILNGLEVKGFEDLNEKVAVGLTNGVTIDVKKMHIATNGFAANLLPSLDLKPARAQVLITTPINDLRVSGTFHLNEGFYYFRNIDGRILLGGGRQLDLEVETTTDLSTTSEIQNELETLLHRMILPGTKFEIEHRWAGVMGVGRIKKTIVEHISNNVSCAVRLGGMGVAIGTSIGKESAAMIG
jgi:hypothetical protein